MQDYARIERKRTLSYLEKAPNVAYQDDLNKFDSTCEAKGLIMTWSSSVIPWKVRSHMDFYF